MSEIVKVTIKYESQTDLSERWTDAKDFAQQLKTVYGVEAAEPDANLHQHENNSEDILGPSLVSLKFT
jgi:hypothetical protein